MRFLIASKANVGLEASDGITGEHSVNQYFSLPRRTIAYHACSLTSNRFFAGVALHFAVQKGHFEVVRALITAGTASSLSGTARLFLRAAPRQQESYPFYASLCLCRREANVHDSEGDDSPPLCGNCRFAAPPAPAPYLHLLTQLAHSFPPAIQHPSADRPAPLSHPTASPFNLPGNAQVIELLVKKKASLTAENKQHKTPLDLATNPEACWVSCAGGLPPPPPLLRAAFHTAVVSAE